MVKKGDLERNHRKCTSAFLQSCKPGSSLKASQCFFHSSASWVFCFLHFDFYPKTAVSLILFQHFVSKSGMTVMGKGNQRTLKKRSYRINFKVICSILFFKQGSLHSSKFLYFCHLNFMDKLNVCKWLSQYVIFMSKSIVFMEVKPCVP